MRILLFNLATEAGDPILGFTTGWIRAIAKQVEFVHVITMSAGRVEVPANVQVYSVGKEKGYNEPRRAVEFYRGLYRILGEHRIDVCFSHMIPIFSILAAPVLKVRGIPIVTWYAHRQVTMKLKLAYHLSDRIVSVDANSYRYRQDKFVALGHGIDTEMFSPDETSTDNPPLILSVGRLSPIKDLLTLIEGVNLLRQKGYEAQCALVGDAPERDRAYAEKVRRRVRALGLEGNVHFVGSVPNTEVVRWYRRCLVHVNCSPADHSLDKAVLETMACGRPSFSSALGFRETMGVWADCLLFRNGDASDLAERLIPVVKNGSNALVQMGLDLRERVIQMHSLEGLAEKLVNLFGVVTQRCAKR